MPFSAVITEGTATPASTCNSEQRFMQSEWHQTRAGRQHVEARSGDLNQTATRPAPASTAHRSRSPSFATDSHAVQFKREACFILATLSTSLRDLKVTLPFSHSSTSMSTICCAESSQKSSACNVFSCQAMPCLLTRSMKSHWVK